MRYVAGVALIVVGIFVAVLDVAVFAVGRFGGWSTGDVAFAVLYAALADATIALGVLVLHRAPSRSRAKVTT
jgi:predicted anti-sigma-YlaC factor YlaD